MAKVFIAYSSKDLRFLTDLRNQLRLKSTHQVFIAEFRLQAGQEWRLEVERNLAQADFFVPLISKNFLDSPEARRELSGAIDLADQQKLTIAPLLIEQLDRNELPLIVRATQYIRHQPFDSMVNELLKALNPTTNPLANRTLFEEYLSTRTIDPNEFTDLTHKVMQTNWEKGDKSRAIKFVADRLRQSHPKEAIALYSLIIDQLYPNLASLRVARAEIYTHPLVADYRAADTDCSVVLANEPDNPWALMRRFWVNHAWALSKPSLQESQEEINRLGDCLDRLAANQATASPQFLASYIRALAEAAVIGRNRRYADLALKLIKEKRGVLKNRNKREDQLSTLQCLRSLSQFFQGLGDLGALEVATSEKEKLEDDWRLYDY